MTKFCNFQGILYIYSQWLLKALSRQEKLLSIAHSIFYYGCHLHMLCLRCSLVVFCLLHFVMFLTLFVVYSFPTVCFEILEVLGRIVITRPQVNFRFVPIYVWVVRAFTVKVSTLSILPLKKLWPELKVFSMT